MSEAAQKTAAWREAKQQAGYVLLAVYVPVTTKKQLVLLAAQRGQSLAACLTDAVTLLTQHSSANETFVISEQELRRIIAEVVAGTTVVPIQERPEASAGGMKQCRQGHLYPAFTKNGTPNKGCPTCTTQRKQRQRAREAPTQVG